MIFLEGVSGERGFKTEKINSESEHIRHEQTYFVQLKLNNNFNVDVTESVYVHVWGACGATRAGSSPAVDSFKNTVFFLRPNINPIFLYINWL